MNNPNLRSRFHNVSNLSRATIGVLAIAACGDASTPPADVPFELLDSAGVTLVLNTAPEWGVVSGQEGWSIDSVPFVSIGASGEEVDSTAATMLELFRATAAILIGDRKIVVGNAGTGQLRCFDLRGNPLWESGSKGHGPGEYERISSIWSYRGDSLLVYDARNRRYSVVDSLGRYGRSWSQPLFGAEGSALYVKGVFSGGETATIPESPIMGFTNEISISRSQLPVYLNNARGGVEDSVASIEGPTIYQGPDALGTVVFSGRPVGGVWRDRLFLGIGEEYRVDAIDVLDRHVMSIRKVQRRIAVTRQHVQHERARRLEQFEREFSGWPASLTSGKRRFIEILPHADTLPAYSSFRNDADGNLWVEPFEMGSSRSTYDVFNQDGRWLGEIDVPARLELYDIGSNYLVGRERDGQDVEYIVVYRINK